MSPVARTLPTRARCIKAGPIHAVGSRLSVRFYLVTSLIQSPRHARWLESVTSHGYLNCWLPNSTQWCCCALTNDRAPSLSIGQFRYALFLVNSIYRSLGVVRPLRASFNIHRLTQLNSPAFYIWPWFRRYFSRSPATSGSSQNASTAVW
jgi:hypothetical protein